MEYINDQGRHIQVRCERCRGFIWMPLPARQVDPSPVTCGDCQMFLEQHPDVAEAEFQMAIKRSQQDSIDMRARWAAQDEKREVPVTPTAPTARRYRVTLWATVPLEEGENEDGTPDGLLYPQYTAKELEQHLIKLLRKAEPECDLEVMDYEDVEE